MSEMTLDRIIKAALMPDDELQCLIDARGELARLRGIEAAAMWNGDRAYMVYLWRRLAKETHDTFWRDAYNAIADALEKP